MNRYDIKDCDPVLRNDVREKGDAFHLDVNETTFFKRQLEYVKTRTYDVKYKNLKAMQMIPISTEMNPGASSLVWYSFSQAGVAKIISDYAHDFPRVDVYATENTIKPYDLGDSYGYSIREVRQAAMAGQNLNSRRANTARRAIDEKMDNLAWFGDSDYNIPGFFNYPGITEYTVPNGAGGSKTWASKTAEEINADLIGITDAISVPTKGREEANQILLPRTQYNLAKNTKITDDKTVLMWFMDNNTGVMVDPLDELVGQGAGGTDRFMAYVKDAEHLEQQVPSPFEQLEVEKKGGEYVVPCMATYAGVTIYYPQSVAYGDGI